FVFVVMVLNREEAEPWAVRGVVTKALGLAALALLMRTATSLFRSVPEDPSPPPPGWGGVADVGERLFTTWLFPFEAISLALLVFGRARHDSGFHVLAFLVIAIAAAEAAVGLAIVVGIFRNRHSVNLDELTLMKR